MNKKQVIILLAIIVFLGVGLRVYKLGSQPFWVDEVIAIEKSIVLPSFNELLTWSMGWISPPFYNILLNFWIKLFGHAEFSVRFLSVIFAILTILLVYKAGKDLFNEEVGLYSAFIMAISPMHIVYSQDGKMYTLLTLLGLLSIYFLYKILIEDKVYYWIGYFVSSLLLIYTHNWGLFLLISENVYFLIYVFWVGNNNRKISIKKYFIIQLLIICLYLPWTYIIFNQFSAKKVTIGMIKFSFMHIPATFTCFTGALIRVAAIWLKIKYPLIAAIGTSVYGMLFYMAFFWGNKEQKIKEKTFLAYCLFLTLIIPSLISFKIPIYHFSRHTIIVLPFFCLIVGYGVFKIKNQWWKLIVILIMLVNTGFFIHQYYFFSLKSQGKLMAGYVEQNHQEGDIIVILPGWAGYPFRYYYKGDSKIININNFMPGEVDRIINFQRKFKKKIILLYYSNSEHPEVDFFKKQLERKLINKKNSEMQFKDGTIIIY